MIEIASEAEMLSFGKSLISKCKFPSVIYLKGDLGAGKTTLVRGFLRGLGYTAAVKSPTYTLVENYEIKNKKIFHFDLYRVHDPEELLLMGIKDYFQKDTIAFIEWPQRGNPYLPPPDLIIELNVVGEVRQVIFLEKS